MADNEQSEHSCDQNFSWLEKLRKKYGPIAGQDRPPNLDYSYAVVMTRNMIDAAAIILELVSILEWAQPYFPSSPRMKVQMMFSVRGMPDYEKVLKEVGLLGIGGFCLREDGLNFPVSLPDPEEALELLEKLEKWAEDGEILLTVKAIAGPVCWRDEHATQEQMKKLKETATRINGKAASAKPAGVG